METETNTIEVQIPEVPEASATEAKKKKTKKEAKPKAVQKKLIVQVPDDVSEEYVQFLESKLKDLVPELELEESEIRKTRPDKGGREKKYATEQDEKEHYKQYFQDYYKEKLKKTGTCQYCNKEFKTYTSVSRHVKRSQHCLALRQQREAILNDLLANGEIVDDAGVASPTPMDAGVASATPEPARNDGDVQLRDGGPTHPTQCNVSGMQETQQ
jgi:hypothetical protein